MRPSIETPRNARFPGDDELRLSFLRPQTRNTFYRTEDSRGRHPGAGDFLDLAGGARSVIDQNALTEPQIDDVLFPRDLLICPCWSSECEQRETAEQQER